MNNRQFAAAHDAYLEPPDDEDEDDLPDEDTLASIWKQQQRDREDYLAETLRQRQECGE